MIISESQMGFGAINNSLRLLDNMYYLSESESQYAPAMVPIIENTNVDKYMIALEDLQEFADSNGISDLGYALTCVCEADNLDPSYVGFTVNEYTITADPDMANMVSSLLNEGVTVLAKPTSDNDPAAMAVNLAMQQLLTTGYDTMLEAIAFNDYYTFLTEAEEESKYTDTSKTNDFEAMGDASNRYRAQANIRSSNAKMINDKRAKGRMKDGTWEERDKMDTLSKIMEKVKNGVNISRDWLAKQIDKLNAWARNIIDKIQRQRETDPDKVGFLTKVKDKIVRVIEILTRKLHDFVQANRGKISEHDKHTGEDKLFGWSADKDYHSQSY